jgi:hypothetical protein
MASSRSSTRREPPRSTCELPILLRAAFNRSTNGTLTDAQLDALVTAAAADLDLDEESPFWQLADQVAELRTLGEPELTLVSDMLAAVAANAAARRTRSRRR